ncbi:hypothetical protein CQ10_42240 [Bradyrhizobium valentinum]|nr:hypothetical protein CQ10_42240 [Bradyrhizobium valentinum]
MVNVTFAMRSTAISLPAGIETETAVVLQPSETAAVTADRASKVRSRKTDVPFAKWSSPAIGLFLPASSTSLIPTGLEILLTGLSSAISSQNW